MGRRLDREARHGGRAERDAERPYASPVRRCRRREEYVPGDGNCPARPSHRPALFGQVVLLGR